jgi:hypothetical protein
MVKVQYPKVAVLAFVFAVVFMVVLHFVSSGFAPSIHKLPINETGLPW